MPITIELELFVGPPKIKVPSISYRHSSNTLTLRCA